MSQPWAGFVGAWVHLILFINSLCSLVKIINSLTFLTSLTRFTLFHSFTTFSILLARGFHLEPMITSHGRNHIYYGNIILITNIFILDLEVRRFTLFLSYLHGSNNLETQPHDTSFLPSFRSILPIILPVLPSLSSCLTFILSFPSCLSAYLSNRMTWPWRWHRDKITVRLAS